MKKQPLYIIELETNRAPATKQQSPSAYKNQPFLENFQTAILLSLLEKGQLAKWQFDFCIEELKKQRSATQPPEHEKVYTVSEIEIPT